MQPHHGVYGSVDRQSKPSSAVYHDDMAVYHDDMAVYHDDMAQFVTTLHARLLSNAPQSPINQFQSSSNPTA